MLQCLSSCHGAEQASLDCQAIESTHCGMEKCGSCILLCSFCITLMSREIASDSSLADTRARECSCFYPQTSFPRGEGNIAKMMMMITVRITRERRRTREKRGRR